MSCNSKRIKQERSQAPYTDTPEQCKAVYAELQDMIIKGKKYPTLDQAVIGDVKRLCRVPYSRHQKTGQIAVPVTPDLESYKLHQGFSRDLAENGLSATQVAQAHKNAFKPKPKPSTNRKYVSSGKLRPCIEDILSRDSVHYGLHIMKGAARACETIQKICSCNQELCSIVVGMEVIDNG